MVGSAEEGRHGTTDSGRSNSKIPEGVHRTTGALNGEYHIRLDSSAQPVQQAPRRIPVTLRRKVKEEQDTLTQQNIIAPDTAPTEWIN